MIVIRGRTAVGLGLAIAGLLYLAVVGFLAGRRAARADEELARIRSERTVEVVDSLGWETRIAEETRSLREELAARVAAGDELAARNVELVTRVEELGGEVRYITDMYVELSGRIIDVPAEVTADESGDSVAVGDVDDGLLAARVAYRYGPRLFDVLDYSVTIEGTTALAELADGRMLATARARDPRVNLRFGEVFYQPPAPVEVCSFGARARAGLWGYGAGVATGPVAELVGKLFGGDE